MIGGRHGSSVWNPFARAHRVRCTRRQERRVQVGRLQMQRNQSVSVPCDVTSFSMHISSKVAFMLNPWINDGANAAVFIKEKQSGTSPESAYDSWNQIHGENPAFLANSCSRVQIKRRSWREGLSFWISCYHVSRRQPARWAKFWLPDNVFFIRQTFSSVIPPPLRTR